MITEVDWRQECWMREDRLCEIEEATWSRIMDAAQISDAALYKELDRVQSEIGGHDDAET